MSVIRFYWWASSTVILGVVRYILWPLLLIALFGPWFFIPWIFIH